MKKHRHKWVKAPKWWVCTAIVNGHRCNNKATYRCVDEECTEVVGTDGDIEATGRCAKCMAKKRKPKPFKRWSSNNWSNGGTLLYDGKELTSPRYAEQVVDALNRWRVVMR
jgi:hypothetical protein